jgi:1-acyl-sn-glycerol-3-phosphate acyltransferase
MRSMHWLRALLITDPLVILATIFFGTLNLIVSFFDRAGNVQIAIARNWSRVLLALSGVRVHVEGLEKIDPHAGYVLAANHVSYMDIPVMLAFIPLQYRFLAKQGLFKIPFLGNHLARAGHIPVYREDARASLKTMSAAADMIRKRGVSILIFPEGGRSRSGELQPFKDGGAYIAIKAGVPIVPVALKGMREILPMGSWQMRSGRVELRIGDPISTAGLTLKDRGRLTEQTHEQIAGLLQEEPVHA